MASDTFAKLPASAKPLRYFIHLEPDFKTFACPGHEVIDVKIVEPVNSIQLYASELDIKSASIILEDGKEFKNLALDLDTKWEKVTVKLPTEIQPQSVKLSFEFVAAHNDRMRGFYRSNYTDQQGEKKYMLSTQFESTYARLVFPCFDEPVYKAVFDTELVVDSNLTALSNMNIISDTSAGNGKKLVKFATTPVMSTYLLAFAVGDFEYIESATKEGVPVRVYTVPGKKQLGAFSLDLSTRVLDWFADWFGHKNPLPKVDILAVPDFAMGAMENWGLVTFREVAVLVDPAKSSFFGRSRVALVVAHELAHFWFGNLTTMKWWSDLWLKEGFASFMEYLAVSYNEPQLKIWLYYLTSETQPGLSLDELKSSHPIEVPINDPRELESIYDSITYAKSNCVIRMLMKYLGEETFREGLRIYVQRFAYKNAITVDLWNALGEASKSNIEEMMSTWTQQMGYPLITVSQEKLSGGKRRLKLVQNRFLADGTTDDSIWQIPVTVVTAKSPNEPKDRFIFKSREMEVVLDNVEDNEWVKLNSETSGFYRVKYSDEMFTEVLNGIHAGKLNALDRFGFTSDTFALVQSGHISATQFLSLLAASANESEFVVWQSLGSGVAALRNVLVREPGDVIDRFNRYVVNVLEPVLSRLGWEAKDGEDVQIPSLRSLLVSNLVKAGHQPTLEKALEKFAGCEKNNEPFHPDLRGAIFATAARSNNSENFAKLLSIFEKCGLAEIERTALISLGQTTDKQLLSQLFKYAVDDERVRAQDLYMLFYGASATKNGQDFAWDWFRANYGLLLKRFGEPSDLFARCFEDSFSGQSSESFAKEVEKFYTETFDEGTKVRLGRSYNTGIETVLVNAKLLTNHRTAIDQYLTRQN